MVQEFASAEADIRNQVDALAAFCAVSSSLADLNLQDNGLHNGGVHAICEAMTRNKDAKLASLNVGKNDVSAAGAKSVAALLTVAVNIGFVCATTLSTLLRLADRVAAAPLVATSVFSNSKLEQIIFYFI